MLRADSRSLHSPLKRLGRDDTVKECRASGTQVPSVPVNPAVNGWANLFRASGAFP